MNKLLVVFTLMLAGNLAAVPSSPKSAELASAVSSPAAHADPSGLVTAHRGSSDAAPENTLSSMRQAIRDGAGYGELDVQETADGVLVVMHDDNARRTTGINKPMWEIDSRELREASAGRWFGKTFESERVPTLDEVIETVQGRMKLNIELKNNGHQKRLAEKAVSAIERHDFVKECTVTSFDTALLAKVKHLNKNIKTGLILGQKPANPESVFASQDYEVLSTAYPLVDETYLRLAKQHNKEVYVWTVNDPGLMNRMIDYGVSSIITNHPARLVQVLKKRGVKL
ncbi:glycerophosphodiester phosphodiesterase family protein [Paenibacillus filicis]|uniref:Glycerophosphodiester phosphodiesterase family protein n=1 Tax=Paenibacillus gyeongsangnamensis TaxID=3388067 RepID=A0ABT4Q2R7_9BACL|nr:glycerophosphodiester phosphodiesterase family protein [Paenibacillus filicis]MCZ8511057.1 glycerophosphodiester phosphodiesterase family protein [Paenibacillus filicis]